jgi:UDP-glucuronate 4-epimerase
VVEGLIRVLDQPATPSLKWDGANPDPGNSSAPWRIYNIGNSTSIKLTNYIAELEKSLGRKAMMEMLPPQPGDMPNTFADVNDFVKQFDYKPVTAVSVGIANFVNWYQQYYNHFEEKIRN